MKFFPDMIAFDFNACKDGNDVKPFRYEVSVCAKCNVFEPKKLDPGLNLMDCRYSQLGAAFIGKLHQLSPAPASLCKVLWEAMPLKHYFRLFHSCLSSLSS